MDLLESACLEDYLAVALRLSECAWARLVLTGPGPNDALSLCSNADHEMARAFDAIAPSLPDLPVFIGDIDTAALGDEAARRASTAGLRALGALMCRFSAPDGQVGAARLELGDARVRHWDETRQALLSGFMRTVQAHLTAAAAARASADQIEHLEAAQALAHVGSWEYRPAGRKMRASRELVRIFGQAPDAAERRFEDFLDAVHIDDRGRTQQAHQGMLDHSVDQVEYRIVRPSGEVRWVRERSAVQMHAGELVSLSAAVQDITFEKQNAEMQRTLHGDAERAQQQFRAIFESSPTPYLVLTPERYQIVAVSDAYLKATMVTRQQIMGREVFDVFPDDPQDPAATGVRALSASLDRVRQSKAPDVMAVQRYPVRRGPGEDEGFVLKYWSPVNSPVLNVDRSVAFIIHRVEDVTDYVLEQQSGDRSEPRPEARRQEAEIVLRSLELKRLADSLAESESRFRYIGRATNDAVWDWYIGSDALWCGESAQQPLGAALEGAASLLDWCSRIHAQDRERVHGSLLASLAERKEHWNAEYRLCGSSGAPLDVLHRCFLMVDEQGTALRMVGSITDITERKRQESRLRELAELLDYATDAILVRDLNNRITYWNGAAVSRYGWSAEEVIGRPVSETLYVGCPPDEFAKAMQMLLRTGDFNGRMVQSARDGRHIVVHSHWILVRHQDGSPRAILSVATDLSEKLALEQRLAQVQKLESLGRLTGGIAHDFNNWLTVILGNAEELADELHHEPQLAELAVMIQMAGQRGAELTRRLLAFARRQSLEPQTLDVQDILEAAKPLIKRSLREDIDLQFRFPAERWQVYVDRSQLEAAILNLCINARDAMQDGGTLTVELINLEVDPTHRAGDETLAPGEYVVVRVMDTGRGIAPELIERVFEPFFTTKEESGGSGLGLSTVYGFATQSNGGVTIDSRLEEGTVVKVYLPRTYHSLFQGEHLAEPALRASIGLQILLVEDDPQVRGSVVRRLEELGYDVTACATGMDALVLLDAGLQCELLFTDIVMPSMTGIELAERATARRPGLRVLLSSGYTFDALHLQGELSSRYRMLHKPYGKKALVEALEGVLREDIHGRVPDGEHDWRTS